MTSPDIVADVAARLTKAQRRPLIHAVPRGRNLATCEPGWFETWARTNTLVSMRKLGLIEQQILTPLGIAVRAHLQGSKS